MQHTPLTTRRRPLPGSRAFNAHTGPAIVVAGTRAGVKWAKPQPRTAVLVAPLDLDPGAVEWPVKGSKGITLNRAGAEAEFITRLVQALLADGAELVVSIGADSYTIHRSTPQ